ncbi:MAG: class I SAM-dependent methyltransferase [candidate division KSB1 bacterium]|nr:class I SAM-dependent methyltransferase [candidate division KSB1 bacterium]MDZ7368159.1 class I SAM-dependent methyltransferase [candidate division KSB1 bacterium]MDZ7405950.1 class I SAM-dependent methyltransferase [candidate division KSB1 bacterium]
MKNFSKPFPARAFSIETMVERRRQFFERCTAFRLCHHEFAVGLTVDYYAGYLLCNYYQDFPPGRLPEIVKEFARALERNGLPFLGAVKKFRPENLSHVSDDKGMKIHQPVLILGDMPASRFTIEENDLQFAVSFHEGHSTGLFLDIKHARQLVRQITKPGHEVLNLFSYTGGFSIAAAAGGASRVIEVDTGAKWLRWARENQALNGVTVVRQRREDAVSFLHKQKAAAFDLIICDPPTYSTAKSGGRFTVEKSYRLMVEDFHRVLRPSGHLLACTNYRALPKKKFFSLFVQRFKLAQEVPISEDFAGDDYLKVGLFRKL